MVLAGVEVQTAGIQCGLSARSDSHLTSRPSLTQYLFSSDFSVTADLKNSSWRVLDLDQPTLGISREYLVAGLQHREVAAYLSYMVDIATMLGADRQQAEVEMLEVVQFEMELANISLSREERRDSVSLYNPMTIQDLYQLDPATPWLEHINNLLTKVGSNNTFSPPAQSYLVLSGYPASQPPGAAHCQRPELRARSEFSVERHPAQGDG